MAPQKTPEQIAEEARTALAQQLQKSVDALIADLQKADGEDAPPADDAPPMDDAPPAEPDGDEAEAPMAGDGASMPSHEELVAAFQAMAPEELQAYSDALAEAQGGAGGGDMPPPDDGAPPMDDAPPVDGADDGSDFAAMKSEMAQMRLALAKSRREVADLKKSVTAAKTPARPQPRARTGQDRPAGSPPPRQLAKGEIEAVLLRKSRDPKTLPHDRELINGYYCGQVKLPQLDHLFKGTN